MTWTVGSVEYAQERSSGFWRWREGRPATPALPRADRGATGFVDSNTVVVRVEVRCCRGFGHTVVRVLQTEKARHWERGEAQRWADGLGERMRALLEAEVPVPRRHAVRSWDNGDGVGDVEAQERAAWQRAYLCGRF